ncbi:hypothetical protein AK812_SmicGene24270 [Symbiodinium microadriaticum]|uniref:Glycosyltransferase 2-like domain-containing protein n=1 Tax=Symbiodinium microadriaticum TaxID=2951 RepID=A0A1Q9DF05_SYMMI|nr:hypothetical protein AK812_SmicGene24270 [Symbiodinium microadriaticum]
MPSPPPSSPSPPPASAGRSMQLPPGQGTSIVHGASVPYVVPSTRVVLPAGSIVTPASPPKAGAVPTTNWRPVPYTAPYPNYTTVAAPKATALPAAVLSVGPTLPSKSSEVSLSELSTEAKTDSPIATRMLPEPVRQTQADAGPAPSSSPLSKLKGLSSGAMSPVASAAPTPPTTASKSSHPRTPSKRCHIRSDSVQWTQLERDLFESSSGLYHPTEMASMRRLPSQAILIGGTGVNFEVPGRVSIVAPSMSKRQHYHENLWRCFEAQTWADKELIVVETYEDAPSKFLQQKAMVDERIVHITIKVQPGQDFTVGLKRNMTLHMATGGLVVQRSAEGDCHLEHRHSQADKELIVVETYEDAPSKFLQQKAMVDERIVHITIKVQPGQDFTVGLKRNMTLHMATGKNPQAATLQSREIVTKLGEKSVAAGKFRKGEYIVNFDDDDLYAPGYVAKMVSLMQKERLVGVTLSAWYNYYIGKGVCTFSDPESWDEWVDSPAELDDILYGYGFSYTHRRQASLLFPYPNVGFAEDAPFFLKLREVYGNDKVLLYKDVEGLCIHIMHRANTAQVLGSRNASAQEIASLEVACLTPFQKMIDNDFFRFSPWRPPVRLPALSAEISADWVEEEAADVIPKLRASTLEGPGGFDVTANPPMRPRVDSFRNSECSEVIAF